MRTRVVSVVWRVDRMDLLLQVQPAWIRRVMMWAGQTATETAVLRQRGLVLSQRWTAGQKRLMIVGSGMLPLRKVTALLVLSLLAALPRTD